MAGTVHAIALLGLLLGTGLAVSKSPRRPSWRRILAGLGGGFLSAFLALGLSVHACTLGQPVRQATLPALCLSVAVLFVAERKLRLAIVSLAFSFGVGLSLLYALEVHGSDYIGVPKLDHPTDRELTGPIEVEWHSFLTGLYRRTGRGGTPPETKR